MLSSSSELFIRTDVGEIVKNEGKEKQISQVKIFSPSCYPFVLDVDKLTI